MSREGSAGPELSTAPRVVSIDAMVRPPWVERLFAGLDTDSSELVDGLTRVQVQGSARLTHVRVEVPAASSLPAAQFQRCVTEAYAALTRALPDRSVVHPVRFWNFIPDIHRPTPDGMCQYEVFNVGRLAAFEDWYQSSDIESHMIASSAVGHREDSFVAHVLAADCEGRGLENPRQCSAFRYSRRYGPVSPSFARATVVADLPGSEDPSTLILAGTASVVGEDSAHVGDFERQFDETCINLATLVDVASSEPGSPMSLSRSADRGHVQELLAAFRELRIYLLNESDHDALMRLLGVYFSGLQQVELMAADVCRPDLLVEIEGTVPLK